MEDGVAVGEDGESCDKTGSSAWFVTSYWRISTNSKVHRTSVHSLVKIHRQDTIVQPVPVSKQNTLRATEKPLVCFFPIMTLLPTQSVNQSYQVQLTTSSAEQEPLVCVFGMFGSWGSVTDIHQILACSCCPQKVPTAHFHSAQESTESLCHSLSTDGCLGACTLAVINSTSMKMLMTVLQWAHVHMSVTCVPKTVIYYVPRQQGIQCMPSFSRPCPKVGLSPT